MIITLSKKEIIEKFLEKVEYNQEIIELAEILIKNNIEIENYKKRLH